MARNGKEGLRAGGGARGAREAAGPFPREVLGALGFPRQPAEAEKERDGLG